MNEEELLRRAQEMQRQGVPPALIVRYLEEHRTTAPGARFADPTVPAKTSTGEEILPTKPGEGLVKTPGQKRLAGVETVVSGLTQGLNDELTGAVQAAGAVLPGGRSPREAYTFFRDQSRERKKDFAAESPGLALGLEALGAAPTMLAAAPTALAARGAQAAGVGAQAARAAGVGMAAGGVGAFGRAEGTPREQADQTAMGALVGGGLGAVIPPLAAAGGWVGRVTGVTPAVMRSKAVQRFTGAQPADDAIIRAAERGGTPLADMPAGAVRPDMMVGAQIDEEAQAVLQRAMRVNPDLKHEGNAVIAAAQQAQRDAGEAIKTLTVPQPKFSPPIDTPDLEDLLRAAPAPVQRIWRKVQQTAAHLGRKLPTKTVPFAGTYEEALQQFPLPQQVAARIALGQLKGPIPAAEAIAMKLTSEVPVPTLESLHLLRRSLDKEAKQLAKGGGAEAARFPIFDEARQALDEVLEREAPELMEAIGGYARASDAVRRTVRATGATRIPGPGAPKYEIRVAGKDNESVTHIGARAAGSVAGGNPKIGFINTVAEFLTRNAHGVAGKTGREVVQKLLKSGPEGQATLLDLIEQAGRRPDRLLQRAGRAGFTTGTGAGLLSGYLPKGFNAPPQ